MVIRWKISVSVQRLILWIYVPSARAIPITLPPGHSATVFSKVAFITTMLFPHPPHTRKFPVPPRRQHVQKPSRSLSLTFAPTPSMLRKHRSTRSSVP